MAVATSYEGDAAASTIAGGGGRIGYGAQAGPYQDLERYLGGVDPAGGRWNGLMKRLGYMTQETVRLKAGAYRVPFEPRPFDPRGFEDAYLVSVPSIIPHADASDDSTGTYGKCRYRGVATQSSDYHEINRQVSTALSIGDYKYERAADPAAAIALDLAAAPISAWVAEQYALRRVLSDGGSGTRTSPSSVPVTGWSASTTVSALATQLRPDGQDISVSATSSDVLTLLRQVRSLCRRMRYMESASSMSQAGVANAATGGTPWTATEVAPWIIMPDAMVDTLDDIWAQDPAMNGTLAPSQRLAQYGSLHRIFAYDPDPGATGTDPARTMAVVAQPGFFFIADDTPAYEPCRCPGDKRWDHMYAWRQIIGIRRSRMAGRIVSTGA